MHLRMLPPLVGVYAVLTACSGGGTAGTPVTSMHHAATGTLTLNVPQTSAAADARKPTYISPSTTFVTLWIDGSETGTRVSCTPVGFTPTCTLNWVSTSGSHTFAVALDDSASVNGGGNVLAEGSAVETLVEGTNTLPTLTLNGVPAQIAFRSETLWTSFENSNCEGTPGYTSGGCYSGSGSVEDADGNLIESSPHIDGGGLCLAPSDSSVGATSSSSCITGANASFAYLVYQVACQAADTGVTHFTLVATPTNAGPYGELSATQLATYNLTYPNQASIPLRSFPTYTCDFNDISD